mmetsp:Transcript_16774/g.21373  ORF Transcript_16774/g.21373 Transcript_16774/m.21373 type:complete len:94 (+) Transcript_16774:546-827(+)
MKSLAYDCERTLSFRNMCNFPVRLRWIDYSGSLVFYADIEEGEVYPIDTYATHPWFFTSVDESITLGVFVPTYSIPASSEALILPSHFELASK